MPVWVICHVMLPIIDADMPAPIMVPLESSACPTHVPVSDVPLGVGVIGLAGIDDPLPHADPARAATKVRARNTRMLLLPTIRRSSLRLKLC